MKKVSLDTWIQLLGMIGLLGGLVFVGLELQQNQTNASASQVQARTNNTSDVFIAPMDGQIDALAHWYIPWEDQTETQKLFSMQFKRWQSNIFENNFYQYSLGLLSEEHWQQQEYRIQQAWNECEYRDNYQNRLQSFMDYLASLPDRC